MAHHSNQDLKLHPPKFTGKKGEQIKQFFSRFEKFIQDHQVAQDDRVTCLGIMLDNDALEYYDHLIDDDDDQEYEDLKESLILRFDDPIRLVIRGRNLKVGESITEYYGEMEIQKQTGPPTHGQYSQSNPPWYEEGATPYHHNVAWHQYGKRPFVNGYNHWNNYPRPAFRNNAGYNTNRVGQSGYTTRRGGRYNSNSNNNFIRRKVYNSNRGTSYNTYNQGPGNKPGGPNYWQTPPNNTTNNRPPKQNNQGTNFRQHTTNNALDITENVTESKSNDTAHSNIVAAERSSVSTGTPRDWCQSCKVCAEGTPLSGVKETETALQPIPVGQPFEILGVDIVGPLPNTISDNTYKLRPTIWFCMTFYFVIFITYHIINLMTSSECTAFFLR
jgi:hypothetical protein